jgi:hypothetical protein
MINLTTIKDSLIMAIKFAGYDKTLNSMNILREKGKISEYEYNYMAEVLATLK